MGGHRNDDDDDHDDDGKSDDGKGDEKRKDGGRDPKEKQVQKSGGQMRASITEGDKAAAAAAATSARRVQLLDGAKVDEGYYFASPLPNASWQPTSAASPATSRMNSTAPPPAPDHDGNRPEFLKGAWRVTPGEVQRLSPPSIMRTRHGPDDTNVTHSPSDEDVGGFSAAAADDDDEDRRPQEQFITMTEGELVEAIDLIDAEFDRSRRKKMIRTGSLVLLVVVVAIVAVAVGVTLSLRRNSEQTPPTLAPTLAPTFAPEAITTSMFDAFLSDSRLTNAALTAMRVEGTPQAKALQWLQGKVDNRSVIRDDAHPARRLVQQYALAVLYYASTPANASATGEGSSNGWTNSSGWLVDLDECEWFGCECRRTDDGSWELDSLDLSQNGLAAGTLPAELGILDGLAALDLSGNSFSGTIPSELGRLTNLQSLALTNNTLTGAIPLQLYQATDLLSLDLDNNLLRGSISSRVGQLSKLTALNIWANEELTGTLPTELGLLTELTQLVMFSTRYTAPGLGGTIPRELGAMRALAFLTLSGYGFSGTIPEDLAKVTSLSSLVLRWNQLSGTLPPELGSLSNLGEFDVSENEDLTGTVPEQLCSLIHDNSLALCVTSTNVTCSESCGCTCV